MRVLSFTTVTIVVQHTVAFQPVNPSSHHHQHHGSTTSLFSESEQTTQAIARRQVFQKLAMATATAAGTSTAAVPFLLFQVKPALAVTPTGSGDGLLDELPNDALRSYLQYRIALQIFADFYLWDFQRLVQSTDDWGEVGQLFRVNSNRGQGQPSRIERDFTNPVRIMGLSLPPDEADKMRDGQFKFEKAMAKISKVTSGIRRDLPVEISSDAIPIAMAGWEEGRVAINEIFTVLNEATGLKEMKPIPPSGPKQNEQYGRSSRRYFDLVKKTKLCQNRGGPALSQGWGKLMVSGYLQDSCGLPGKSILLQLNFCGILVLYYAPVF